MGEPVLTPRQLEIVRLVAKSMPDKEIARKLGISYFTVKNTMALVRERLRVQSRLSVVVAALELGLLTTSDLEAPRVSDGVHWH